MIDILTSVLLPAASFAVRTVYRNALDTDGDSGISFDPDVSFALSDDGDLHLSPSQLEEISAFLETPAVRSLVRMAVVYSALDQLVEVRGLPTSYGAIQSTFLGFARDWCERKAQTWSDAAPQVWARLAESFDVVARSVGNRLGRAGALELAESFHLNHLAQSTPPHLQAMMDIANGRLDAGKLARKVDRYRSAASTAASGEFDVQGGETTERFDALYIERTFVNVRSSQPVDTSRALDPGSSAPRAVVIGDPGAGKSTLMKWLDWRLAQGAQKDAPIPLSLLCRSDLVPGPVSLIEACRKQAESLLGELLDVDEFNAMLALGVFAIMVDGVDEIPDRERRKAVVAQLDRLERNYPLAMMVCSTRKLGFEVPLFTNSRFDVYSLEEYDEDQVAEYAGKWFAISGHDVRADRFLGESRHLSDLRSNPLMLALLCALYSQHGYIPQSRRDIYTRCASLMFHEWDPKRGIHVPNVFKARGDRILYDIARNLDQRDEFAEGITKRELERIVRDHLESSGVLAAEALASTREFIEHCSTRAWILSATGQGVGEDRRYAFTHRTFFEYFAAEAHVRALNRAAITGAPHQQVDSFNISPLTRAILTPFWRDSTSVMPELILQAAQDQMGDVSHMVLQDLITLATITDKRKAGDYVALAIRLLAAAGAGPAMASRVLSVVGSSWKADPWRRGSQLALESFRSLLDIASGHRERFFEMVREDEQLATEYLTRFGALEMSGEVGLYGAEWATFADELLRGGGYVSTAATVWLSVRREIRTPIDGVFASSGVELLRVRLGSLSGEGVFWTWIRQGAEASPDRRDDVYKHVMGALEYAFVDEDAVQGQRGVSGVHVDDMVPASIEVSLDEHEKLPPELSLWFVVMSQSPNLDLFERISRRGAGVVAVGKRLHRLLRSSKFFLEDLTTLNEAGVSEWAEILRRYRQISGGDVPGWLKTVALP